MDGFETGAGTGNSTGASTDGIDVDGIDVGISVGAGAGTSSLSQVAYPTNAPLTQRVTPAAVKPSLH